MGRIKLTDGQLLRAHELNQQGWSWKAISGAVGGASAAQLRVMTIRKFGGVVSNKSSVMKSTFAAKEKDPHMMAMRAFFSGEYHPRYLNCLVKASRDGAPAPGGGVFETGVGGA